MDKRYYSRLPSDSELKDLAYHADHGNAGEFPVAGDHPAQNTPI